MLTPITQRYRSQSRLRELIRSCNPRTSWGLLNSSNLFITEELVMQTALKYLGALSCAALATTIAFAAEPTATPRQDKYTV